MRFAAKEAFSKALGVGLRRDGIRWREVEVVPNPMGKPELQVSGRAAELCAEAGITGMHLSLTDEDGRALAVVILEKNDEATSTCRIHEKYELTECSLPPCRDPEEVVSSIHRIRKKYKSIQGS
jgi:hypothetical protein